METLTAQQLVARNVGRVLELRERSQSWLARQLGWSKQKANKLVMGTRGVTVEDLLAVAVALEVAPAVLLVPWEDTEELTVELRDGEFGVSFDSADGFGWITGAPDPSLVLYANPTTYFGITPTAVQRRYGREWLRTLREEQGWTISDDGSHVEAGGIGIHRGDDERSGQ